MLPDSLRGCVCSKSFFSGSICRLLKNVFFKAVSYPNSTHLAAHLTIRESVLSSTRRGLQPRRRVVISALELRWWLNFVVRVNKQCCRMSTQPAGSFTAPNVDITALLSEKRKAKCHNWTQCQNKYSKGRKPHCPAHKSIVAHTGYKGMHRIGFWVIAATTHVIWHRMLHTR